MGLDSRCMLSCQKVQVGNYQEKAQSEIPTPKTDVRKTKLTIRYLYLENISSEQLFPNRWSLSYPNFNKNMKTYIRLKQHKKSTPKHKTDGTTTEVSPRNDQ